MNPKDSRFRIVERTMGDGTIKYHVQEMFHHVWVPVGTWYLSLETAEALLKSFRDREQRESYEDKILDL
jgi:hypothetical protein